MNLVNEGVLQPNEPDDRDERREEREMAQERETVADIVADIRERAYNATRHGERTTENYAVSELLKSIADRIEAAWKRERERDGRLLFRLLWFDVEDYQSDWACNAYRRTIKDCCARLGVQYHNSGKEIAEEMDKTKQGIETAREVYDE